MTMNILLMSMITINTILLFMMHPLSFTILIILQTIFLSLTLSKSSYSSWFSYILFLIFLGGMLVLFIYMTSLASNEMFLMPKKSLLTPIMMTMLFMMFYSYIHHMSTTQLMTQDSLMKSIIYNTEMPHNLTQLYNLPSMNITIMMISYLLITLIVIVKITEIHQGPLRQQF
uniref:NADH-ubiquinone oxidoreductase chain 6 n=1 Tax=Cacoplistes rogenhoferi TaxID=2316737 RepID=A0A385I1Y0_9ORTH|nr:NADH dehydrogenase subunit 6 [Cacoplistes rogenhoferi]AXY63908.1 NADH dehydrogenase subunit 6 [Cacoplistes rogenhoferi]